MIRRWIAAGILMMATAAQAEWDNIYAYGTGLAKPDTLAKQQNAFSQSVTKGTIYDESMRNRMTPVMVEVEDRMSAARSDTDNQEGHTKNFYYSTNKRDYYRKEVSGYRKFPTTN